MAPRKGSTGRLRSSAPIACCVRSVAEAHFGFYSAREFEVGALIARHPGKRFLELGRSCVADGLSRPARARAAVAGHLGLCAATSHRRDVRMREFPGADPARTPPRWLCFAATARSAANGRRRDRRAARRSRAGGERRRSTRAPRCARCRRSSRAIGGSAPNSAAQAVIDPTFGTTDVLAVLPIEEITVALSRAFRAPQRDAARSPPERDFQPRKNALSKR